MSFDMALAKYAAYYRDRGFGTELDYISNKHSRATGEGGYLLRDVNDKHIAYVTKDGKVQA